MKIRIFSAILLVALLALTACGANKTEYTSKTEKAEEREEQTTEPDDTEALEEKLALYDTEVYFADALIPHKYLIISADKVVCFMNLGSMGNITEIPRDAISGINTTESGTFSSITIYNAAQGTISFNASESDTASITAELNN